MSGPDLRDAPRLMTEVVQRVTALARTEMRIMRAELSDNLSRAGSGMAFYAGALVLAVVGLQMLVWALVAWLETHGVNPVSAAGAVGAALLASALLCGWAGRRRVSAKTLVPRRSLDNAKRDLDALQEIRRG